MRLNLIEFPFLYCWLVTLSQSASVDWLIEWVIELVSHWKENRGRRIWYHWQWIHRRRDTWSAHYYHSQTHRVRCSRANTASPVSRNERMWECRRPPTNPNERYYYSRKSSRQKDNKRKKQLEIFNQQNFSSIIVDKQYFDADTIQSALFRRSNKSSPIERHKFRWSPSLVAFLVRRNIPQTRPETPTIQSRNIYRIFKTKGQLSINRQQGGLIDWLMNRLIDWLFV